MPRQHVIPHSHDDLGWRVSIDQYYQDYVYDIFKTVLKSLSVKFKNKQNNRKFVYSEVAFLKKYLNDPTDNEFDQKVNLINELIKEKKFEFVNGGMSQADSACTHYQDLILNLFYG